MAEEKKKEKKKRKERMDINLPNARRSMKRSREMRQERANYEDMWKFIGTGLALLAILFVLLGGINQRTTIEAINNIAQTIGNKVGNWLGGADVEVTEDGVYLQP